MNDLIKSESEDLILNISITSLPATGLGVMGPATQLCRVVPRLDFQGHEVNSTPHFLLFCKEIVILIFKGFSHSSFKYFRIV